MSRINTGRPVFQKGAKKAKTLEKGPFMSKVLRNFAKGQECQMKSKWCNGNPATTVLCHSRRRAGAGMAQKPHDFWGYHGCSDCHANEHLAEDGELYDAIRRTQDIVYSEFRTLTP